MTMAFFVLSLTTDQAEITPKEEKGGHQDGIKVSGMCRQHTPVSMRTPFLQQFVADLLKVTASYKQQTSP